MTQALLFKAIPLIFYGVGILMAIMSSLLIYTGLTSKTERANTRLRIKQTLDKNKQKIVESTSQSGTEELLEKAGYPLGLNGLRYNLFFYSFICFLLFNYLGLPIFLGKEINSYSLIGIVIVFLLFFPKFPYSLFVFFVKKVIDFREAKKNAEIFNFYDLLITELEMMTNSRINTYNILRNLQPYFTIIKSPFVHLLSSWSNDEGPHVALDKFAKELGTTEAKRLVTILKNMDEVNVGTALESLKGMSDMFARTQIESYRRRNKITNDLLGLPIRLTHFLIIFNFMAVVITMVMIVMDATRR